MSEKLTTASVLAFERKLDPSDAVLHAGLWADQADAKAWVPVTVREKSVRGTISNRLKTKDADPAKLDAAIQNPNLQTVDVATLPSDADTLRVRFTLRVLAGAGTPSACNSASYQAKLLNTVKGYVDANGFTELAQRYAAARRLDAYAIVGFTHSLVTLFDHPDLILKFGRSGVMSLLDSLPAARKKFTEQLIFGL